MRWILRFVATVMLAALAQPALAQADAPNPNAPSPQVSIPTDRSLNSNICGTLDDGPSAMCRNGVVYNPAGDPERKAAAREEAVAEVHAVAEQRKLAALALAERVRNGATVPPALVAQVRDGLARDLQLWRAEYQVDDAAYAAAVSRWVRAPESLTPAEWVLWRAAWYDERDRWLASRRP